MDFVFIILMALFGVGWLYNVLDRAETRAHRLRQRQKRRGW